MLPEQKSSKTMNILLWIAQVLLALIFVWAGFMKVFLPGDLPYPWVKDNPDLALFTGVVDLLAGIGIVLPTLLRVKTGLAVFAAYGIVALMMAASIFHISRGETKDIGFNIFILLTAIFVLWGRQKMAPTAGK